MPARDPMSYPKNRVSFRTMHEQLQRSMKRPLIGVSQGGSSRKGSPAKVAATDGRWRPSKIK